MWCSGWTAWRSTWACRAATRSIRPCAMSSTTSPSSLPVILKAPHPMAEPNTDQKIDALENRVSGLITTVEGMVATRADSAKKDEGEKPEPTMAALTDAVATLTKQFGDFVKRDARRRRDEDTDSDKD